MSDLTCIHREQGLCPECQAAYDTDPAAFAEFGDHADGLRRWEELKADMDADQETARRLAEDAAADAAAEHCYRAQIEADRLGDGPGRPVGDDVPF